MVPRHIGRPQFTNWLFSKICLYIGGFKLTMRFPTGNGLLTGGVRLSGQLPRPYLTCNIAHCTINSTCTSAAEKGHRTEGRIWALRSGVCVQLSAIYCPGTLHRLLHLSKPQSSSLWRGLIIGRTSQSRVRGTTWDKTQSRIPDLIYSKCSINARSDEWDRFHILFLSFCSSNSLLTFLMPHPKAMKRAVCVHFVVQGGPFLIYLREGIIA